MKEYVGCIYGQVLMGYGGNNSGLWPAGGNNSIARNELFH